jgi:hypothetical protein
MPLSTHSTMVLYNFEKEALVKHLNVSYINNNTKIAPISFSTNKHNETDLEDKVVHFMVLNVTAGNKANGNNIRMQSSGSYGVKKTNYTKEVSYNRYWICTDLAAPPNCFAIITRTAPDTSYLLKETGGKPLSEVFTSSTNQASLFSQLAAIPLFCRLPTPAVRNHFFQHVNTLTWLPL